ncbi:MAG: hypothetical protein LBJ12_00340 [Oscillospiraceae bacterium]|jgi:hypothetical protein|nr:hypothetical protein [Oscillospiraceae bacterium]
MKQTRFVKRLLAVLLAVLTLVSLGAVSAFAAPLDGIEIKTGYHDSWEIDFYVNTTPEDDLDGPVKYTWSLYDAAGNLLPINNVRVSGSYIEFYSLTVGEEYKVAVTATLGRQTFSDEITFTFDGTSSSRPGYPGDDLDYYDLDDAVFWDYHLYDYTEWRYTTESWNAFQGAWYAARDILYTIWDYEYYYYENEENENLDPLTITQDDIDTALVDLKTAFSNLQTRGGIYDFGYKIYQVWQKVLGLFEDLIDWLIAPFGAIKTLFV